MNTDHMKEKILIFNASGKNYSLPVDDVVGVLTLRRSEISPVPFDVKNRIRGIFNYKGGIVGLLRCDGICAESDENGDDNLTAVLLRYGQKRFAVLVDYVREVTESAQDDDVISVVSNTLYGGEINDNN